LYVVTGFIQIKGCRDRTKLREVNAGKTAKDAILFGNSKVQ
jgi:hypothetical protein